MVSTNNDAMAIASVSTIGTIAATVSLLWRTASHFTDVSFRWHQVRGHAEMQQQRHYDGPGLSVPDMKKDGGAHSFRPVSPDTGHSVMSSFRQSNDPYRMQGFGGIYRARTMCTVVVACRQVLHISHSSYFASSAPLCTFELRCSKFDSPQPGRRSPQLTSSDISPLRALCTIQVCVQHLGGS